MTDVDRASSHPEVLLVEDNPGDVRLVMEAFDGLDMRVKINAVEDGVQAMAYLRREGKYAGARRPDLILLDLNLPRKDGRDVLREVKADDDLKQIPIIVLTSSAAEDDIYRAYSLGANCYVTKPVDLDRFLNTVRAVEDFWLRNVRLPKK